MARYLGPVCKLCRREGGKLYLKGDRCFSEKCSVSRRPYPPGQHGQGRIKLSEYGLRLREKQKMRRIYGLLEKQFAAYYVSASHLRALFKRTVGTPVHEYVIQRRVERARALLLRGDLPASQVALDAGFSHQSHMARCMRRVLGVTPATIARSRAR